MSEIGVATMDIPNQIKYMEPLVNNLKGLSKLFDDKKS